MKNYYEIKGDVTEIHLSNYELITTIDTADLDFVLSLGDISWSALCMRGVRWTYVVGQFNKKIISLHRVLMRSPKNKVVDHINHNTMDNRRSNLQVITNAQNIWKRSEVTYEWQEKLANLLKERDESEEYQNKKKALQERKEKKKLSKEKKSRRYTSVQTGIEWDPKKKRFEPIFEYKAI